MLGAVADALAVAGALPREAGCSEEDWGLPQKARRRRRRRRERREEEEEGAEGDAEMCVTEEEEEEGAGSGDGGSPSRPQTEEERLIAHLKQAKAAKNIGRANKDADRAPGKAPAAADSVPGEGGAAAEADAGSPPLDAGGSPAPPRREAAESGAGAGAGAPAEAHAEGTADEKQPGGEGNAAEAVAAAGLAQQLQQAVAVGDETESEGEGASGEESQTDLEDNADEALTEDDEPAGEADGGPLPDAPRECRDNCKFLDPAFAGKDWMIMCDSCQVRAPPCPPLP